MTYLVKTLLGRYVDAGDWEQTQSDTIRKVLFDASVSPFNPGDSLVALTPLCNASGLAPDDVKALCGVLEARKEIEISGDSYRLTAQGRVVVRNIMAHGPFEGAV
jgi:hypothetical protein